MLYHKESNTWKIADFGFTVEGSSKRQIVSSMLRRTACYCAPELLHIHEFSQKTDIWAVGCIFHEVVTETRAFQNDYEVYDMWNKRGTFELPILGDVLHSVEALTFFHWILITTLSLKAVARPNAKTLLARFADFEMGLRRHSVLPPSCITPVESVLTVLTENAPQRPSIDGTRDGICRRRLRSDTR